jgi:hypothetical protein
VFDSVGGIIDSDLPIFVMKSLFLPLKLILVTGSITDIIKLEYFFELFIGKL